MSTVHGSWAAHKVLFTAFFLKGCENGGGLLNGRQRVYLAYGGPSNSGIGKQFDGTLTIAIEPCWLLYEAGAQPKAYSHPKS